MRKAIHLVFLLGLILLVSSASSQVLVIHGGAGTILRERMGPEVEAKYRITLQEVLDFGFEMLANGSSSDEALVAVISLMENSSLFNAGKGAVLNAKGKHELDASIMRGEDLAAGSVAGVMAIKNPILAARIVMNKSKHVMLSGAGADRFAKEHKLAMVANKYFRTERRVESYKSLKKKSKATTITRMPLDSKFGTVGCVALDLKGNLCAGTSTGGMSFKKYGRVGDSPIIGAGTYADNQSCAVSCTGHGEYFIRLALAKSISDRQKHLEESLQESCDALIHHELPELGGTGGVIALNTAGDVVFSFNTKGMYRAYRNPNGSEVKIFASSKSNRK